jgi:hypothetical protein
MLAASGPWIGGPPQRHWTAEVLAVTRGSAQLGAHGLSVVAPDATGTVVISINQTGFRSKDYPVIAWDAVDVPDGVEAALLWNTDFTASRVSTRALAIEAGRILPVDVAGDRNWIGTIRGIALVLRGSFAQPILVRGATAKPATLRQVLGDRVREWLAFEPWNGTSINTVTGGADAQELPLPALVAAIVLVAALLYVAVAHWAPGLAGAFRPTVVAAIVVLGWLVLDARWQWNLIRQVRATYHQYAGRSWHDRHLAAEDSALFAFIEKARDKLPPPVEPAPRVFMVADLHYFRDRGAYHLYPYNVYFDPWRNTMPPSSALRSGDYLIAYQRKGVQYDPGQQRLRWDGGAPVAAELLFADAGAALFRIR